MRPILAASWDFGRSWPIPMTAAVSGRLPPATMDKALLRSALRACFDDMTQRCPLLLVLASGVFLKSDLARRSLMDSHLEWPVSFTTHPRVSSVCTGTFGFEAKLSGQTTTTRLSGQVHIGLLQRPSHSGAKTQYSTTASASFDCEATGGATLLELDPRDAMRSGSNFLIPAL